jgi:hypothetical protein
VVEGIGDMRLGVLFDLRRARRARSMGLIG